MRSLGSREWVVPRVNRGQVLDRRGDTERARKVFGDVLVEAERTGRKGLEAMVHAFVMRTAAREADWPVVAWHGHRAADLLRETGVADADVAAALEEAGEIASAQRQPEHAMLAWSAAREQWRAMRNDERVGAMDALIRDNGGV